MESGDRMHKNQSGLKNCYAHWMARRLHAMGQERYRNNFAVTLQPDVLEQPLRWIQPRKIFVNSMSDLFHPEVPFFIRSAFYVRKYLLALLPDFNQALRKTSRLAGKLCWYDNIWMGVSVENANYTYRIEHLRKVPAAVRFRLSNHCRDRFLVYRFEAFIG